MTQKIGLIDVDGHNFPNIPLMKISAWHKKQGDHVEWYDPMFSDHKDKVTTGLFLQSVKHLKSI